MSHGTEYSMTNVIIIVVKSKYDRWEEYLSFCTNPKCNNQLIASTKTYFIYQKQIFYKRVIVTDINLTFDPFIEVFEYLITFN